MLKMESKEKALQLVYRLFRCWKFVIHLYWIVREKRGIMVLFVEGNDNCFATRLTLSWASRPGWIFLSESLYEFWLLIALLRYVGSKVVQIVFAPNKRFSDQRCSDDIRYSIIKNIFCNKINWFIFVSISITTNRGTYK